MLEAQRESWGEAASHALGGAAFEQLPHMRATTMLLVAGVQYLLLRARKIRQFGGVNLQSEPGWDEIKHAIRVLAVQLLSTPTRAPLEFDTYDTQVIDSYRTSIKNADYK